MTIRWALAFLIGLAGVLPLAAETPQAYGSIPLIFEPNLGQADAEVRFMARGRGYGLLLTETEAALSMALPDAAGASVLRMKLAGQTMRPEIHGLERLPGTSRYFFATEPAEPVPHFASVRYGNVYPGIDLVYYGNQQQLQYDFILDPQANPDLIGWIFAGVDRLSIDGDGALVLHTAAGDVVHEKPFAFQEIDGTQFPVAAEFVLRGEFEVGFKLGAYDRSLPLVIDPVVLYSSYMGGTTIGGFGDQGNGIAVDAAGNAYIAGYAGSTDFWSMNPLQPELGGNRDVFVLKLDASGSQILAATYFGGAGNEEGMDIALDGAGNIYVAGYTTSDDFPVVNAIQTQRQGAPNTRDAFVVKLNGDASAILYSTYLGGTGNDVIYSMAVLTDGTTIVAGETASTNFPTTGAAFQPQSAGGFADAFVTKLSASGSLIYSTYLGGFGYERVYGLTADPDGNAYAVGFTTSVSNFPTKDAILPRYSGGDYDAFLTKINTSGSELVFSTYFGGESDDQAVALALDDERNVYVTGYSDSFLFPARNSMQLGLAGLYDAFLLKFQADGQDIIFSTLIGGTEWESGNGVAVDSEGSIYVTGLTNSLDFYAINGLQNFRGGVDGFLMKLTPDGALIQFSTHWGGFSDDGIIGFALDAANNSYLTGYTSSHNFFVSDDAFQDTISGCTDCVSTPRMSPFIQDGFVSKINADDVRSEVAFSVPDSGGLSIKSSGLTDGIIRGFATVEIAEGSPAGMTIIELLGSSSDELIGLPLVPLVRDGRLFVEHAGSVEVSVNTAISIMNPGTEDVTIEFYFTNGEGTSSEPAEFTIPAGMHFSGYALDAPFNTPENTIGTLTFSASHDVAVTAFRAQSTTSSPLLGSHVPIANPNAVLTGPVVVPQLVDGEGWGTQVVLVNTTEDVLRGEVRFLGGAGDPLELRAIVAGATIPDPQSAFAYEIPARSAQRILTMGESFPFVTGYVEIVPEAGFDTPAAHGLTTWNFEGIYTFTTSFEAQKPESEFLIYVESSGDGSDLALRPSRSAVAIVNPGDAPAGVTMSLYDLEGQPTGFSANFTMDGRSHRAQFLHHIEGLEGLPDSFKGILRVAAPGPGVTIAGLVTRYNRLGRFYGTTTGPLKPTPGGLLVMPHIAEGDGYATQFILLDTNGGAGTAGILRFYDSFGSALDLAVK